MIVLINFDFFLILVFSSVFGPTLNPPSAAKPQLQASTQLVQLSRRSCCPSSRFPQSVCSVISTGKCLHKQHRQCYGPTKTKLIHKKKWFFDLFFCPCWILCCGPTLNPLEQQRHTPILAFLLSLHGFLQAPCRKTMKGERMRVAQEVVGK